MWSNTVHALRNIFPHDNPVEEFNEHQYLLARRYVSTKVIREPNKDKPWFDDECRHAFILKQETHLLCTRDRSQVNWKEFVRCEVRPNVPYKKAMKQ